MNLRRLKKLILNSNISDSNKKRLITLYQKIVKQDKSELLWEESKKELTKDQGIIIEYVKQILSLPDLGKVDFVPETKISLNLLETSPKLIAYYLPQFYPFKENDEWWGKGTTEWTNVSKAVPQFVGHYQPRLPGELGFYDLRLKDNMVRQVELAKNYGIHAFCFYYYWFGGKRLLEKPLDMFIENKDIDFKFCLCWANENWTRRFDGSSSEVLMRMDSSEKGYREFITGIEKYVLDSRYLVIDNKIVFIIYRPSNVPNTTEVIKYWRDYCYNVYGKDLYLIGVDEVFYKGDLLKLGFDAVTEFHPGTIMNKMEESNNSIIPIRKDFSSAVYNYPDIVKNKLYNYDTKYKKLYKSVMPMWDNTARRNNKGGTIFINSEPILYQEWLTDVIDYTIKNEELDDKLIFINAWNEWAEGAYLEPDKKYGYAYLEATRNAIMSYYEGNPFRKA